MQARERLWLTADRKRLVPDGHRDAATLYAAPGDDIPDSAAQMFGIVDGRASKQRQPGEDKRRKGGEDKGSEDKGNGDETGGDDLTKIKGIGDASARALAAAGIDSFAKLAAVDPKNPPEISASAGEKDWVSWTAQARMLITPLGNSPQGGGLTINKASKGA